ncbi:FCD domain-containing protein [Mesorhizobium sp. M0833]|uniref:FCD domain-containing protein n=1 Tax=Mesorhizobium sp. M0833 TaxID=2957009 RepID=UPI0033398190
MPVPSKAISRRKWRPGNRPLLAALRANLRYQSTAVAADDRNGLYQLDVEFHQLLTQCLGLDHVGETLGSLGIHLERVRRKLMTREDRHRPEEHRAVFEADRRAGGGGPPCAITSTIPPSCWNSSPGKIPPFSDRKNAPGGHRRRQGHWMRSR